MRETIFGSPLRAGGLDPFLLRVMESRRRYWSMKQVDGIAKLKRTEDIRVEKDLNTETVRFNEDERSCR